MKLPIIIIFLIGLTSALFWSQAGAEGSASGANENFASTTEEMVRALASPASPSKARGLHSKSATRGIQAMLKKGRNTSVVVEQVPVHREGGFVQLKVEFDTNASTLRSEGKAVLDRLAAAIKSSSLQDRNFSILGHTDSDGSEDFNLRLALDRAEAVQNYLTVSHRIPADRFIVRGFGKGMPMAPNDSAIGKQKNRRVEIVAIPGFAAMPENTKAPTSPGLAAAPKNAQGGSGD